MDVPRISEVFFGHTRFSARIIRATVRSSFIRHSHTRSTLHPSFRNLRATLTSLRRFENILDFQNVLLVFEGRSQRGHPCQKHPSTKRATLDFGHAKSGLPATGHCFLNPRILRCRSNLSILRSVVPPEVRTDAIIFDRTSRDTLSIAATSERRSLNPRLGSNLPGRVDSDAPPRF